MATQKNGAGRRNRTDDTCVEDRSFTSKLYPLENILNRTQKRYGQARNFKKFANLQKIPRNPLE